MICFIWRYISGNDVIHQLTSPGTYELKIVLTDWSNVTKYAEYSTFRIADESHGYRLSIWGYTGTAGLFLPFVSVLIYSIQICKAVLCVTIFVTEAI